MRFAFSVILAYTFLGFSSPALANTSENTHVLITIGADAVVKMKQQFREDFVVLKKNDKIALVRVLEKDIPSLSEWMHKTFERCGGFIVENKNVEELMESFAMVPEKAVFEAPTIRRQETVNQAMSMVEEKNIRAMIESLSSYQNRLYRSQHGVNSQQWVGAKWKELAKNIPNTELEFIEHSGYPQRSVILTIKGSSKPNEIVVIGGHGDSISGWSPDTEVRAPGADDNASGIATITEAIRVLGTMNFRPERTIKFMSYAAEEVGLRGSQDIASQFKNRSENVVGVMQLDMTNYTRRPKEVVIMTDYTNEAQNTFLKNLIRTYNASLTIAEDECGYACSDHASWTQNGYAASIPFESRMSEYNHAIHTARDTIAMSNNNAEHAFHFSKIALSYLIEMSLVN